MACVLISLASSRCIRSQNNRETRSTEVHRQIVITEIHSLHNGNFVDQNFELLNKKLVAKKIPFNLFDVQMQPNRDGKKMKFRYIL